MTSAPLPYGRQWLDDDDIQAVVECLRSDWLTQGPRIEQFEAALCQATGAKHTVAVSSGTAALHLAALVAGVGPGDTGITAAVTFVASANCIAYCGGTPHFADVDPATGLIDIDALEATVNRLTTAGTPPKVIIPVDLTGQPADLPAIQRIAARCGAKVIEDAAHSLGATYRLDGRDYRPASCAHTDMAILSFHPVKAVTTGEGGAVTTNDATLADRLRTLRSHGIHRDPGRLTRPDEGPWYHEQDELGYHYRITDMQCALGLSQMKKLDRFVARRNDLARQYDAVLAQPPLRDVLRPVRRLSDRSHAYHLYVVQLVRRPDETPQAVGARRKALYLALRERGVFSQVHYIPVPWQPYYRKNYGTDSADFPGASAYYHASLSLPLFPRMKDEDVGRVAKALVASLA